MEKERYDKVDHKQINSMDDIDNIVKNEVKLDKKRKSNMKMTRASAETMSFLSRIIIAVIVLAMLAIVGYLGVLLYPYFF